MRLWNPIVGLIVLVTIALFSTDPGKPESIEKDLRHFQSTWKITTLEAGGIQAPAEVIGLLQLVFREDSMTVITGEPAFAHFEGNGFRNRFVLSVGQSAIPSDSCLENRHF